MFVGDEEDVDGMVKSEEEKDGVGIAGELATAIVKSDLLLR